MKTGQRLFEGMIDIGVAKLARIGLPRTHGSAEENHGEGWVSWDPHPWRHPWLRPSNLRRMKAFSRKFLEREKEVLNDIDPTKLQVGFSGNLANSLYLRARAIRTAGVRCHIFLHPHDQYVMSHPAWEELDAALPGEHLTQEHLRARGEDLECVPDVHQFPATTDWRSGYGAVEPSWLRGDDISNFAPYLNYIDTLAAMQEMDVLWGASNGVYFPYLANRPYVVSQTGGDIWFEASRGDMLGRLVRSSFGAARIFLASNPWTFAHARRYGFRHVVYLPLTLDETLYTEGQGNARRDWESTGGSFFVLTSSRLDERTKGSSIGIEGFARFARAFPEARLVLIGWGAGYKETDALIDKLGIADKVLRLPVSGKGRVRDYLRSADAFLDQFVLGYFGAAGLEAMACGLPVIGRIEAAQYDALCETGAPPILNARSPAQVARHLTALASHSAKHRQLRTASRRWFLENHSSRRWMREYLAVLAATAARRPADFSNSPLAEGLSFRERIYHARGLMVAPPFPSYGW